MSTIYEGINALFKINPKHFKKKGKNKFIMDLKKQFSRINHHDFFRNSSERRSYVPWAKEKLNYGQTNMSLLYYCL
jgi:hypothetical protein